MKQKPTNNQTNDPMEEAYKQLDGSPSATGVSDAARGIQPENDDESFRENTEQKNKQLYGCDDIDQAYANLFQAVADIMRLK